MAHRVVDRDAHDHNPASGAEIAQVPLSTSTDVDAAVQAAKAAFPSWRATPSPVRARILFRLKALLEEHKEELAVQLTKEHGKILAETRGEVQRGIENVEHACGIPTLMMGDTVEEISKGIDSASWRQPLGVFGIITPYNFPVMIPLWFWPYAVATGNTVVLKPSEQDPLTHQKIVELAREAGLPDGVLNVVHGGREVVETICDHPDIVGVSFVGSSDVAKIVYTRASAAGKRVQTLGGAKNFLIVLPDADMDATLDACAGSIFGSSGQRCLAGSVVVGVGDAHHQIRDRILDYASSIRIGDGLDSATQMGPVISGAHRDRVKSFIDQGVADGARLSLDGRGATVEGLEDGYWVGPTVFEDVTPDMSIGRRGDLRPGREHQPRGQRRGRHRDDAPESIRKRLFAFHHERACGTGVPIPGRDQHDRHQHRCRRSDGLLPVRRLEAVVLRRPQGRGQGRDLVLHGPARGDLTVVRGEGRSAQPAQVGLTASRRGCPSGEDRGALQN